ncbi:mechanosensitive ion channel domain-containing protein [Thioalkalicoccus limnaeus]|uniref:Mechanosensitive ion channel domain-containing protein n=1 Tax=Thioalkalicoccus limnaeus TaxID=120681 RepID=A0ABV4BGM5_9GAMM
MPLIVLLVLTLWSAGECLALETAVGAETRVTAAEVERHIQEIEAAAELDEETKTRNLELLRRALSQLDEAQRHEAQAVVFAEALTTAPAETATIREALARSAPSPEPLPPDLTLTAVEQRVAQQQAEIAAAETRLAELDKVLAGRAQRPDQIRHRVSEIRRALDDLSGELGQMPLEGEPRLVTEARRFAQVAARQALWAEGNSLEQELLSFDVRTERRRAERDQTAARLERLRAELRQLEEVRNQMRRAAAEQAEADAKAAERDAAFAHPLVQDLTRRNTELSQAMTALTAELDGVGDSATQIRQQIQRINEEFTSARQRIEIAGVTHALGQVLIERRQQLPDLRVFRTQMAERQEALANSMLRQLQYDEERRTKRQIDGHVERETETVDVAQREAVAEQLRDATLRRLDLLDQAMRLEESYQRTLSDLNFATAELLEAAAHYDAFLAERLLWVRNALPVDLTSIVTLPAAIAWFLAPAGWSDVARVAAHEARSAAGFWVLVAVVVLLLSRERAIRKALRATAEPLRRIRTDSFKYTLQGLALTAVLAAPWPLLLAAIGWLLVGSLEASVFTRSVGTAAIAIAIGLYYLRAFRTLCLTGGVADRHFRWSSETLTRLRRNFDWVTVALVPIAFVAVIVNNQDNTAYSGSLGRLMLVLLLLGFTVFFARLLHPTKGVFSDYLASHPDGWANRLRYLWYSAIEGVPLALVALALLGYVYTAGTLLQALVSQLWLALALVVLHQSIVRWLMVTRRHLAFQAALERQAARRAEAERQQGGEVVDERSASVLQVDEPEVDLASLDEQTRKLINMLIFIAGVLGLWLIWRDMLPALGVLDRIALWHFTAVVDDADQLVPFTLADFALVVVISFAAFAAARHLPALLEILLLKQTSVSAGTRYAITTLVSYGIFAVAILFVFGSLGMSWSQAQWLVAALGVGIGFGLQEIVANFISGLIILFERPVRVGDIVTVGDTTGVVTKIQIRATTIRNWDRQELLVPNKEFITGRLLNWTLTDQINRITITVGVSYGSDTRKALELLSEVAREHERVLDDPAPLISFEGFGDNSLTLVLRCFLPSLDGRLGIITELHQAIDDKFAAAGVEIAFPQRDIHLHADQPLGIQLMPPVDRVASGRDTTVPLTKD